jgi:hypothetical protein
MHPVKKGPSSLAAQLLAKWAALAFKFSWLGAQLSQIRLDAHLIVGSGRIAKD